MGAQKGCLYKCIKEERGKEGRGTGKGGKIIGEGGREGGREGRSSRERGEEHNNNAILPGWILLRRYFNSSTVPR